MFRTDTKIWLEKPVISISGINNPETVIFGPFVTFSPGNGSLRREFTALNIPPSNPPPESRGLHIILETNHLGSLAPGSPVSYREVPIGTVTGFSLSPTFQKVYVAVTIAPPYQDVVRENSKFWNISGTKFEAGLFSGLKFEAQTLETIIKGGIALATPDNGEGHVRSGHHFQLHDKPEPTWLEWTPDLVRINPEK